MVYLSTGILLVLASLLLVEARPAKHATDKETDINFEKRLIDDVYELSWTLPRLIGLKNRFESFMDPNKDGTATFAEVKSFLQKYDPNVNDELVRRFINRRDNNGDGMIAFIPEYLVHITLPDYSPEAATEWFQLEDSNNDGYVSRDELVTIAHNLGLHGEEAIDTVDGYYMTMDSDGDSRLSWDEYKRLYMQ